MKGMRRLGFFLMVLLSPLAVGNQVNTPVYGWPVPQWNDPPVPGETAEVQRQHASIFNEIKTGKDLRVLATEGSSPLVVRVGAFPGLLAEENIERTSTYPNSYLILIAGISNAVVVGTLKAKASALTGNGEFIFSDFQMNVEDVLKDNPEHPIKPKSDIIITRPGGTLEINGRTVYAVTLGFRPFQIGSRYVLFLNYIPATGAYRPFAERSFRLLPTGVSPLSPNRPYKDLHSEGDPTAFIQEVRDASAAGH